MALGVGGRADRPALLAGDGVQAAKPTELRVAAAPVKNFRREIGAISGGRSATSGDGHGGLGIRHATFLCGPRMDRIGNRQGDPRTRFDDVGASDPHNDGPLRPAVEDNPGDGVVAVIVAAHNGGVVRMRTIGGEEALLGSDQHRHLGGGQARRWGQGESADGTIDKPAFDPAGEQVGLAHKGGRLRVDRCGVDEVADGYGAGTGPKGRIRLGVSDISPVPVAPQP
jgi:hypothetical protein